MQIVHGLVADLEEAHLHRAVGPGCLHRCLLFPLIPGSSRVSWKPAMQQFPPHRYTMTGISVCVSAFCVSLPSSSALRPLRPCEAVKITSNWHRFAVSMMASNGENDRATVVSTSTLAAFAPVSSPASSDSWDPSVGTE